MSRKYCCKRLFCFLLVAFIVFNSVFFSYQKSVKSAEWIAGTIATIGGGPILTALVIGGCVVAGGLAIHEIAQTNSEDYRNFVSGVKSGFEEFVADQEKKIALEQDSSLTDQEASDLGVANARDIVNNFSKNCIETVKSTGQTLKKKVVDYWKAYNSEISDVADNGVSGSTESTGFQIYNSTNLSISNTLHEPLENGLVEYNGKYYCQIGNCYNIKYGSYDIVLNEYNVKKYDTNDRINFLYVNFDVVDGNLYEKICRVNVNKLTGEIMSIVLLVDTYLIYGFNTSDIGSSLNNIIPSISMPTFIGSYNKSVQDLNSNLSLISANVSSSSEKNYQRTIDSVLNNTHIGKSIKSGRRQLVQSGDYIGATFVEDSTPVKKSSLAVNEGVVSGRVGWDIPAGDVWDDVLGGSYPWPRVIGDTGVVSVPDGDITGTKDDDTTVDFPEDTPVQDSQDVTLDPDVPIEDKPIKDIIDEQGGSFYPTSMDLTNIFPFCIPFDIIYLVEKFDIGGERSPVIEIPIVYPEIIQDAMGSDSYLVTIDFSDFLIIRNILRFFLLLLFIVGLLKITRDLIRG